MKVGDYVRVTRSYVGKPGLIGRIGQIIEGSGEGRPYIRVRILSVLPDYIKGRSFLLLGIELCKLSALELLAHQGE